MGWGMDVCTGVDVSIAIEWEKSMNRSYLALSPDAPLRGVLCVTLDKRICS